MMPTKIRPCIICKTPSAHDCDEMICGYLCDHHLNEWNPWGGAVQEAWERYCLEMPEVRA